MKILSVRRIISVAAVFGAVALFLQAHYFSKPRVLAVQDVPIAFWAWRNQAPTIDEVQDVFKATNAKTLFLRAGQFDLAEGIVKLIRPVAGTMPSAPELHLVYNGTRKLLREFEKLEADEVARVVADTYRSDLSRAANENVEVRGLQLDLDVPTRLLPQYAKILRRLREKLPPAAALSITGLPTWAESNDIDELLSPVDFWIPQCYGSNIPLHLEERIPISSSAAVARTILKVRRIEKPFYAGLSAYGYAILYDEDGSLLELLGDIDPSLASANRDLELIGTQTFNGDAQTSEIRYEYRAKSDLVLEGLIIKAGETLVLDLPTAASLRAGARAVRENAGETLLGICIFRLPTAEDKAMLSAGEIAAALTDIQTKAASSLRLETVSGRQLRVLAENKGNAGTSLKGDALTIDLGVPAGSISGVSSIDGFTSYETLCRSSEDESARRCSNQRANVIHVKAQNWKPGGMASIALTFRATLPSRVPAELTTRLDDGRVERESFDLKVQNRGE